MKIKSFYFLLTLLLSAATYIAYGQQNTTEQNSKSSGVLEISSAEGKVSVKFRLEPSAPGNIMVLLTPTREVRLTAHIIDKDGKELIEVVNETVTHRYANNIDISSLSSGNYFLEITGGSNTEKKHRIAFSKWFGNSWT